MSKLFNKQEAIDNFITAIEYRRHNHEANDSNYTKDIVKYQIATKLIELFPDDVQFEMYDIPLNNKQNDFIIGNCNGTVYWYYYKDLLDAAAENIANGNV